MVGALGDVPETITFDVAPKQCEYLKGNVLFTGVVTNVASWPRSLNMYELASRRWFDGVNLRVVCEDLEPQNKEQRGVGDRVQPVTESKASACVDMLWPNAPSSVRQAHIRRAMGHKVQGKPMPATPAAAQSADYHPEGPQYPYYADLPGVATTQQDALVVASYAGSPTDRGVLDPSKSGTPADSRHCTAWHVR